MKTLNLLRRIIFPVFITFVTIFFIHCAKKFDNVSGLIFIWGSGSDVYDPSTAKLERILWDNKLFTPKTLCKGYGDTLLIISRSWIKLETDNDSTVRTPYPLFKYVPLGNQTIYLKDFNDSTFSCNSLDYHSKSGQYLYCGKYKSKWGMFRLDNKMKLISSQLSRGTCARQGKFSQRGYILDNHTIIFHCDFDILLFTDSVGVTPLIANAKFHAISHDRKRVIYSQGRKQNMILSMLNLEDMSSKRLQIFDRSVGSITFSPNDRFLAYTYQTYNLFDTVRLQIYDLATDKDKFAWVTGAGSLLWTDAFTLKNAQ